MSIKSLDQRRALTFQQRLQDWYIDGRHSGEFPPMSGVYFSKLLPILAQFGITRENKPDNYYIPHPELSDAQNRYGAQLARNRRRYQRQVLKDFGRYRSHRTSRALLKGQAAPPPASPALTVDPNGNTRLETPDTNYAREMERIAAMRERPAIKRRLMEIQNRLRARQGLAALPLPETPSLQAEPTLSLDLGLRPKVESEPSERGTVREKGVAIE